MTTGNDLINTARTFLGEPYSTGPGRADPNSGYKDCSGLIAASYLVATGDHLGADVSVTIYDLCVSQGLWCPFNFAANIAGACLLMPEDPYQGWGPKGHIGFSDGIGGTVEATPNRVQELPLHYQRWGSNACLLPGIDYSGVVPEPEPEVKDMGVLTYDETGAWWVLTPAGTRYRVWTQEQADALFAMKFIHTNQLTFYAPWFINTFLVIMGPDPAPG